MISVCQMTLLAPEHGLRLASADDAVKSHSRKDKAVLSLACFSTDKFVNRPKTSVSPVSFYRKKTYRKRRIRICTSKKTPGGAVCTGMKTFVRVIRVPARAPVCPVCPVCVPAPPVSFYRYEVRFVTFLF